MAKKVYLQNTVIRINDTNDSDYEIFISRAKLFLNRTTRKFTIKDIDVNINYDLGTFDNIRKDDDSIPVSIEDAITYLTSFINFNNGLVDGFWFINQAGELEYNGTIRVESVITDPSSVLIGDATISAGGRIISARSGSTGNRAAFPLQLFDDNSYKDATIYDKTPVLTTFPVQVDDDAIECAGGCEFQQVALNDVQFMKVCFKPAGGVINDSFQWEFRIAPDAEPIYKKTFQPGEAEDLGGGVFEITLDNPSQFDAGTKVWIYVSGIDLLGGYGYDGSDGVRFGEPDNNWFFPYIIAKSIPINRIRIAIDNIAEISADTTHSNKSAYFVDTTAGPVTISIPHDVYNTFYIYDAARNFDDNSCFVHILDENDLLIHDLEIDVRNRSFKLFHDGTVWKYVQTGRGRSVSISSSHKVSTDIIDENVVNDGILYFDEAQTARIRYSELYKRFCFEIFKFGSWQQMSYGEDDFFD